MIIQQSQKDELIKRAVEHREADRLIQSFGYFEQMDEDQAEFYNRPGENGARDDWQPGDWAGCAIGCLASPVLTQQEYRDLYKRYLEDDSYAIKSPFQSFDSAVDTLEEEFGIDPSLTRVAEQLFESLPKDDAVMWPEQFARALPVGVPFDLSSLVADSRTVWQYGPSLRIGGMVPEQFNPIAQKARDQLLDYLAGVAQNVAV